MAWGVLIGVTWTSLGTVLEVGMGSWWSSQGLSDVHSQKRVRAGGGLGLKFWWCMPRKGLGRFLRKA